MTHEITTPFGKPGFLVVAGSRMFGIETDSSDWDYIGAEIEPIEYRLGMGKPHEQYEFHEADHEGSIYALWKMARMLTEGNPTILTSAFAQPLRDDFGISTPEFRALIASRNHGKRFLGYMQGQRKGLLGQGSHTNRPDLIAAHGYDTKFAGHLVRLGYQGCEYLETGSITLPMPWESPQAGSAAVVRDIRAGNWTAQEALREADALEARMKRAYEETSLPEHPDHAGVNEWLIEHYRQAYLKNS